MAQGTVEEQWAVREEKLLAKISETLSYYRARGEAARICHRISGIVVLIGSILAPVTVASGASGGTLNVLGVPAPVMAGAALIITLVVAFAEGLRRIFRFDQRWGSCFQTRDGIWRAREIYRETIIGHPVASEEWKKAYLTLKNTFLELTQVETTAFFDTVKAEAAAQFGKSK